jgi:hypothetical protein
MHDVAPADRPGPQRILWDPRRCKAQTLLEAPACSISIRRMPGDSEHIMIKPDQGSRDLVSPKPR